jgi:hypothetical protein
MVLANSRLCIRISTFYGQQRRCTKTQQYTRTPTDAHTCTQREKGGKTKRKTYDVRYLLALERRIVGALGAQSFAVFLFFGPFMGEREGCYVSCFSSAFINAALAFRLSSTISGMGFSGFEACSFSA